MLSFQKIKGGRGMSDSPKWKVKIPTLGKTPTEVEAETPLEAVNVLVSGLAKRVGERVDIMARRLDRMAEVKGETGPAVMISLEEACPRLTSFEEEISEGMAEALSESLDNS